MVAMVGVCSQKQWRSLAIIVCAIIASMGLGVYSPACAANYSSSASVASLNEISVPGNLLRLLEQVLSGPKQEAAALDYQIAVANTQATLGNLQPQLALSVQASAYTPFSDANPGTSIGVIAGPGVVITLPTGQGQTQLSVGAVARTGYSPIVGAQANINTQIPLLAGPDTRLAAGQQALSDAQVAYLGKQRQLLLDAAAAYYAVAEATQELTLADQLYQLTTLDYTLGEERYQRGTLSATELYRLRSARNSAVDNQRTALFALEKAKANLQALVGSITEAAESPASPPEGQLRVAGPTDRSASAWVALALARRDDLRLAQEAVAVAEFKLQQLEAQSGKEINFVASATWPNKVTESTVDLRADVQAGVQATFYLSDPGRKQSVVAAQATYAKAQFHSHELEQQIARDVAAALYRIQEAEQALAQAQTQLEQDEMDLTVVQERLALGLAVKLEAAAQELNVAQQASRIQMLAGERVMAYLSLWHTVGLDAVALQVPAL